MSEQKPIEVIRHENMMRRGSMALGAAIDLMLAGGTPRTPDTIIWTTKSGTDGDYVPHWGQKAA